MSNTYFNVILMLNLFPMLDQEHGSFAYVADSNLVQSDHSNQSSRSQTPEPTQDTSFPFAQASPLRITTVKVLFLCILYLRYKN